MSGWERPTPPPDDAAPRSYWAQAAAPDPLGPGQLIRAAWRLYRSAPRRLLLVAAVPAIIQVILALPSLAIAVDLVQAMVNVMADYVARIAANPEVYQYADSQALQAELEARLLAVMVPREDLLAWSAIGGGVAGAVGLIGSAAMTATALATAAGRPIPAAFAFRLVAARAGLLKPIVALGIGWAVVAWVPLFLQTSTGFQTWAGAPGSPRSILIATLLSVLALVVIVGIIVLAVRWALYIPAVLVEALGVGPGLARAAQLTRGIRVRLALAMAGIVLLFALLVGIVAVVAGFAVGIAAGSVELGLAAYLSTGIVGNLLIAPLLPAMLAQAYRERTRDATAPAFPAPSPG